VKDSRYDSRNATERWFNEPKPRLGIASLLLVGLVIGIFGALSYAWLISPVVYVEASPARLGEVEKNEYLLLVSQNNAAGANWDQTRARLAALGEADIGSMVSDRLEMYLRQGERAEMLQNLAVLARRLGSESVAVSLFVPPSSNTATPTVVTVLRGTTPEHTPMPTVSPLPSLTPTQRPSPTPVPVYRLLRKEQVCLPGRPAPRIEVVVVDPFLEPSPGIEVIVLWDEGQDHFFTGFHPERGAGYGDFTMNPDTIYRVMMADGSAIINNLRVTTCDDPRGGLAGGWRLTFQNTVVPKETPDPLR
jgi:hypothetical protein